MTPHNAREVALCFVISVPLPRQVAGALERRRPAARVAGFVWVV